MEHAFTRYKDRVRIRGRYTIGRLRFELQELRDIDLKNEVDTRVPSMKLFHLFNTPIVACPSMAFKHSNPLSHCIVALSNPSLFELLISNSLKGLMKQVLQGLLLKL